MFASRTYAQKLFFPHQAEESITAMGEAMIYPIKPRKWRPDITPIRSKTGSSALAQLIIVIQSFD